jgi:hypothetical protein
MNRFLTPFRTPYQKHPDTIAIIAASIVLVIDYLTGKHVQFPILYAIPVGLAAWKLRKRLTCLIAILLPIIRVSFNYPWKETISTPDAMINATIRVVALLAYGYLIYRIAWQTNALERKVQVLEGILPICSFCKKIRNDKGEYEQIEKYVSERSSASFSHGICQDCARKMYPEFYKE